jgi:hypothetical protein
VHDAEAGNLSAPDPEALDEADVYDAEADNLSAPDPDIRYTALLQLSSRGHYAGKVANLVKIVRS